MSFTRYIVFGSLSFALHTLIVFAMSPEKTLEISSSQSGTSVNIQFISAPKPQPKSPEQSRQPETINKKTQEKPIDKPIEKIEQPTIKKENIKTAPKVKKVITKKDFPKKVVQSKPPEPKSVKPAQTSEKIPEPIEPVEDVVKKTTEPEHKKEPVTEENQEVTSFAQPKTSKPKLVEMPTFKARPTPIQYPRVAKRRGYEGKVVVEVWLDESGLQTRQIIHTSSGHDVLDKTALATVSKWKFSAYQVDGESVSHRVHIPVNFKLDQ